MHFQCISICTHIQIPCKLVQLLTACSNMIADRYPLSTYGGNIPVIVEIVYYLQLALLTQYKTLLIGTMGLLNMCM